MKIKLSKSQWELIGKKTGWAKEAQNLENIKEPRNSRMMSNIAYRLSNTSLEGMDQDKLRTLSEECQTWLENAKGTTAYQDYYTSIVAQLNNVKRLLPGAMWNK